MRLLKINSDGNFSLTTFVGSNVPSYAILSHTWIADDQELTFQDLISGTGRDKDGYRKIQFYGDQAKKDCLRYFSVGPESLSDKSQLFENSYDSDVSSISGVSDGSDFSDSGSPNTLKKGGFFV
jgi:hypothetical protein